MGNAATINPVRQRGAPGAVERQRRSWPGLSPELLLTPSHRSFSLVDASRICNDVQVGPPLLRLPLATRRDYQVTGIKFHVTRPSMGIARSRELQGFRRRPKTPQ
jgi:hypothetical protein